MHITVKISSSILSNRQGDCIYLAEDSIKVEELLQKLGIDYREIGLVLVDGKKVDLSDIIYHGNEVQILPWFYGG
ncbi:MAG: Mut7-C ubiquitin [Peptococcaceae bacterium]|nr:Mut7-C ubiquitin [Peptococcaceae bacterium]